MVKYIDVSFCIIVFVQKVVVDALKVSVSGFIDEINELHSLSYEMTFVEIVRVLCDLDIPEGILEQVLPVVNCLYVRFVLALLTPVCFKIFELLRSFHIVNSSLHLLAPFGVY